MKLNISVERMDKETGRNAQLSSENKQLEESVRCVGSVCMLYRTFSMYVRTYVRMIS